MLPRLTYGDRASLLRRQEATQAALAADLAAVEARAAAEAAEIEARGKEREQAAAAAKKRNRESRAHINTLAASAEAAARMKPRANHRDSFVFHQIRQYLVKSTSAPDFCLSVPRSDRKEGERLGWRNGVAVLLAACNQSDSTHYFSFDKTSQMLHPEDSRSFCLDFDFDAKNLRPLTVFRCDKTFSSKAKPRHQTWEFFNNSNIRNRGTGKCLAIGTKTIYDGIAVRQLTGNKFCCI